MYAYLGSTGFFGSGPATFQRASIFEGKVVKAVLQEPEVAWTAYMPSCSCPRCWSLYFLNFVPIVYLLWPVLWLPPFGRVIRRLTGGG